MASNWLCFPFVIPLNGAACLAQSKTAKCWASLATGFFVVAVVAQIVSRPDQEPDDDYDPDPYHNVTNDDDSQVPSQYDKWTKNAGFAGFIALYSCFMWGFCKCVAKGAMDITEGVNKSLNEPVYERVERNAREYEQQQTQQTQSEEWQRQHKQLYAGYTPPTPPPTAPGLV